MKNQVHIGLVVLAVAALVFLAPLNHGIVGLRFWGGWELKWPLWFFLLASFGAGLVFVIAYIVLGSTAEALDRRLFHWEPRARRQARGVLRRGREAMERGEEHAAYRCFLRAQRLDPRFSEAYSAMAEWFHLNEQYPRAMDEARKAISLDPSDPGALEQLAIYAAKAGEPGRSADSLIHLLEIRPESHRARRMLPVALAGAGRWEEALDAQKIFTSSLDKDERGPHLETLRGIKTELARAIMAVQPKRAQKLLKEVLKKSPGFIPSAIIYADNLSQAGKGREAGKTLSAAFNANPEVELYEKLCDLDALDSFEQANTAAIKVLDERPRYHALRLARARKMLLRGRFTEAKEELEKISGEPDAFRQLAWSIAMRGTGSDSCSEAEKGFLKAYKFDHTCSSCGRPNPGWAPRCPECGKWNTLTTSEK